jgi:hypothetical protein
VWKHRMIPTSPSAQCAWPAPLELVGIRRPLRRSPVRQSRHFGWVLLWPIWHERLMFFSTEAWISMPGHPIGPHGTRPALITQAVIH